MMDLGAGQIGGVEAISQMTAFCSVGGYATIVIRLARS